MANVRDDEFETLDFADESEYTWDNCLDCDGEGCNSCDGSGEMPYTLGAEYRTNPS